MPICVAVMEAEHHSHPAFDDVQFTTITGCSGFNIAATGCTVPDNWIMTLMVLNRPPRRVSMTADTSDLGGSGKKGNFGTR